MRGGEEYSIRKGEWGWRGIDEEGGVRDKEGRGGRRGIYEGGEEEYNIRKGEGEGDVYMRGGEEYI